MQFRESLILRNILPKIENIAKNSSILKVEEKLFLSGFMFSQFNLTSVEHLRICFDILNSLEEYVNNNVFGLQYKLFILEKILSLRIEQGNSPFQILRNEIQKLIDSYYLDDKSNQLMANRDKYKIENVSQKQQYNLKKLEQQKSLELAKKLLEQQTREIALRKQSSNLKGYDCPLCLESIEFKQLGLLECQHAFHRECIAGVFKQNINDRKFPIRCPNHECNLEVINSDIMEYLSNEDIEKFQTYTFNSYVDAHMDEMSWCPTAGCKFVFMFDKDTTTLSCPLCRKNYCLNCKVEYHIGMTCKEFEVNRRFDKNDQDFINFVQGAKYKQCPKCKFWVQKNQGCDHMTCRCKFQFCYVCGGVYGSCECKVRNQLMNNFQRVNLPIDLNLGRLGNNINNNTINFNNNINNNNNMFNNVFNNRPSLFQNNQQSINNQRNRIDNSFQSIFNIHPININNNNIMNNNNNNNNNNTGLFGNQSNNQWNNNLFTNHNLPQRTHNNLFSNIDNQNNNSFFSNNNNRFQLSNSQSNSNNNNNVSIFMNNNNINNNNLLKQPKNMFTREQEAIIRNGFSMDLDNNNHLKNVQKKF